MQQLDKYGVVVLEFLSGQKEKLAEMRKRIRNAAFNSPEMKKTATSSVMGAFGAPGNVGSFHDPDIRDLRTIIYGYLTPLMKQNIQDYLPGYMIEMLIDRLLVDASGSTSETCHRDEAEHALPDDHLWASWFNPNETPDKFICAPGSHKDAVGNKGFAKEDENKYLHLKTTVVVPPGCLIVFCPRIVHWVAKYSKKEQK